MAINKDNSYFAALNLVTKAVESGAIKLQGVPQNSGDYAEDNGAADAKYLIALIKGLQAEIPKD